MMTEELVMVGYYDYRLVALSVVISVLESYAARNLSERLNAARGRAWLGWLVFGSTVDGIGTWSMHYTGMLAYHLPVPVQLAVHRWSYAYCTLHRGARRPLRGCSPVSWELLHGGLCEEHRRPSVVAC